MSSDNLTRRKFMIAGSAVIASPLLANLTDSIPQAKAAEFKNLKKGTKIYYIHTGCVGCHACMIFCPAKAIFFGERKMVIDQEKCLHCGTCYNECPASVVSETEL